MRAWRVIVRSTLLWCGFGAILGGMGRAGGAPPPGGASDASGVTAARIAEVVKTYFEGVRGYHEGDLIHRDDIESILATLRDEGWSPRRASGIVDAGLPRSDFLVRLFSKGAGRRFMRRVRSYKLIFDRLDRIARVPGGQRMLSDLVRLPDGHRYAAWRPHRGAPNLLDLLPKRGNGRTRTIKDYERPTGRIYTASQLQGVLVRAWRDASARATEETEAD